MNKSDADYSQGLTDGYMGAPQVSDPSVSYVMGYEDGENNYRDEIRHAHADDYDYGYEAYSAVEQGMYDDDPSPYSGTY
jgi:hypothetical protein